MNETKSISFNVTTVKKLISDYYKEYFKDENIKIKYEVFEEDEYSLGRVVITITKKIKIGKYDALSENVLSNEDVINVINKELEKYGYKNKYSTFSIYGTNWYGIDVTLEEINVKKKILGR